MTQLGSALKYWKAVLCLGLVVFAAAVIPAQRAMVVQRSACRSTNSVLSGARTTCPVYTESYHGGIWVFDASLSRTPTGSTSAPRSMASTNSVEPGFHVLALLGELAVSLLLAIPAVALVLLLTRGRRRIPAYGAVRRRKHIRVSKRRI